MTGRGATTAPTRRDPARDKVLRDSARGFTLLEVLVALVLLAMIGLALARTTGFGVQVWRRAEALPAFDERAALRIRLRQWIEGAKPRDRLQGLRPDIVAGPTRFSFLTAAPLARADPGDEARITVEIGAQGLAPSSLSVGIEILDTQGGVRHAERRILVDGADAVSLGYFRATTADAPGAWLTDWPDPDRLPDLVSITVTGGTSEPWPPLVAAPRLD